MGCPGAAVAIVKDHRVVFAKGFGVRSLQEGGKVDADTLFAIGSNTKAFTATAIGQLVQQGKISWDDPVLRWIPGFQMYDPLVTREITIRDLLCHRSGLGTFTGDLTTFGSIYDRNANINHIRFIKPTFDFRTGFGYSNLMFLVAGEIIPRVTSTSWDDFIQQQFFTPLGMKRSNTSFRELEKAANVATPHGLDQGKVVPIPHDNVDNIAPAGAINSSANDMAQWLLLQTGDGMHDGHRVVAPVVIAETRKPQNLQPISDRRKALNPWTHFSTYGLGWGLSDYQGRLVVSHTGGLNGMISMVAMLPEENLGVVVLTDFDTHPLTASVVYHVFDAYLGVDSRDWDKRYSEVIQEFLTRGSSQRRSEPRHESRTPASPFPSRAMSAAIPVRSTVPRRSPSKMVCSCSTPRPIPRSPGASNTGSSIPFFARGQIGSGTKVSSISTLTTKGRCHSSGSPSARTGSTRWSTSSSRVTRRRPCDDWNAERHCRPGQGGTMSLSRKSFLKLIGLGALAAGSKAYRLPSKASDDARAAAKRYAAGGPTPAAPFTPWGSARP